MEIINNKIDNLFREIRSVKIYRASQYLFSSNFSRAPISAEPIITINNIIPVDFDRSIKQKKEGNNRFYEIDCSIMIYSITAESVSNWNTILNQKDFVVEFISNEESTLIGNQKEPLTIDVVDDIKENDTGTDAIVFSIHGSTIIEPWIKTL